MNRRRLGTGLVLMGFGIATAAGFLLAAADLTTGTLLAGIAVGLLILVPLVGFGIFLRVQDEKDSAKAEAEVLPESPIFRQRLMLDHLRGGAPMRVEDLAAALGVPPQAIAEMTRSLIELRVFSGFVHWGTLPSQAQQHEGAGVVGAVEPERLQALVQCLYCDAPLPRMSVRAVYPVVCARCGTEYHLADG